MDESKEEPIGVKLGGYEFYKGMSGFVVMSPERRMKIFKNPREAVVYFAGAVESAALQKGLAYVDSWGYNIFTGEKN